MEQSLLESDPKMVNVFFDGSMGEGVFQCDYPVQTKSIYSKIGKQLFVPYSEIIILCNGKLMPKENAQLDTKQDLFVHVHIPVLGGKGGFGSMLRAIGAQIEKTTNKEACRDLSGRRLRDVNTEKRIKSWITKQAEKQQEAERKKREKLEKLRSDPKITFQDDEYFKEKEEIPQKIESAVTYSMKKKNVSATVTSFETVSTSNDVKESDSKSPSDSCIAESSSIKDLLPQTLKRKNDEDVTRITKKKKAPMWFGDDLDDDEDEEDVEDESSNEAKANVN